jgi:hypothetical protein
MDVSVRCAASFQTHAVEYHRREQLAMLAWRNGGHSLTAGDLLAFVCSPSRVPPAVAALLVLFPWAAFVLRFVEATKLGDDDVEKLKRLRVGASLCDVLPSNVCHGNRLRLYELLVRLVARVTPPHNNSSHEQLTEPLKSTLRDCSCLLTVDAAFIGRIVREYDAVAHRLRWLALPTVLQRKLHYEMQLDAHPWLVLCKASLPSALAALVSLCAPRSLSAAVLENDVLRYAHVQDVRLRLLVQLLECASHYVAVGGCEFVCQAGDAARVSRRDRLFAAAVCRSVARRDRRRRSWRCTVYCQTDVGDVRLGDDGLVREGTDDLARGTIERQSTVAV